MDTSVVDRHSELLTSVDVESRLNPTKLNANSVVVADDGTENEELLSPPFLSLSRLSDGLPKVGLVSDPLSTELLNQHGVVELGSANDFVQPPVGGQYYDDNLLGHDLTEEDKRLAAALVAVQLVQQQKQQHSLLSPELLNVNQKTVPLSPLSSVGVDKPGMTTMVTSYIQAFEEDCAPDQLLHQQSLDRMMKLYQSPSTPLPDLRLPLPPLKKVLTNQTLLRNRYDRTSVEHLPGTAPVNITNTMGLKTPNGKLIKGDGDTGSHEGEDIESDYEAESELKPSRRSLPHKKRIPRKLKTQPSRSIHAKSLKCQKCGETFNTQSAFLAHRSTHSVPTKKTSMFSCEICGSQHVNQVKFFEHLKTHYEPDLLSNNDLQQDQLLGYNEISEVQPVIQQTFPVKPDGELQNTKIEEQGLTCDQCGRTFRRQKAFDTHVAVAHPQIDEFSEPEDMMEGIRHVVNSQTGTADDESDDKFRPWRYNDDLSIPSDICLDGEMKADMTSSTSLSDCITESETDKNKKRRSKSAQCPHCSRVFTHRNSLLYHIRSHTGRRPHQCEVCGKSFFAANALRVHMRMHSGDKPYKCEVCSRSFRQWGDLKYHMTSLHSSQKQYQCEFCGKDFARKYSLIVHRRIHTGEKNYVCEYCQKTFRASSYLVNHRRIHTGEKPYNCDVCHKAFRVKSDMKRHRNTHNKERSIIERVGSDIVVPDQEPESILPDTPTPLNLNMRQDSTTGLTYTRDPLDRDALDRDSLERDPSTVYVWIPAPSMLSDALKSENPNNNF